MAELVGAIAGAVALGETAAQISLKLFTIAQTLRNARHEIAEIAGEVSSISSSLLIFGDVLKNQASLCQHEIFEYLDANLKRFKEVKHELEMLTSTKDFSMLKRLKYLTQGRSRLTTLMRRVEGIKTSLILGLSILRLANQEREKGNSRDHDPKTGTEKDLSQPNFRILAESVVASNRQAIEDATREEQYPLDERLLQNHVQQSMVTREQPIETASWLYNLVFSNESGARHRAPKAVEPRKASVVDYKGDSSDRQTTPVSEQELDPPVESSKALVVWNWSETPSMVVDRLLTSWTTITPEHVRARSADTQDEKSMHDLVKAIKLENQAESKDAPERHPASSDDDGRFTLPHHTDFYDHNRWKTDIEQRSKPDERHRTGSGWPYENTTNGSVPPEAPTVHWEDTLHPTKPPLKPTVDIEDTTSDETFSTAEVSPPPRNRKATRPRTTVSPPHVPKKTPRPRIHHDDPFADYNFNTQRAERRRQPAPPPHVNRTYPMEPSLEAMYGHMPPHASSTPMGGSQGYGMPWAGSPPAAPDSVKIEAMLSKLEAALSEKEQQGKDSKDDLRSEKLLKLLLDGQEKLERDLQKANDAGPSSSSFTDRKIADLQSLLLSQQEESRQRQEAADLKWRAERAEWENRANERLQEERDLAEKEIAAAQAAEKEAQKVLEFAKTEAANRALRQAEIKAAEERKRVDEMFTAQVKMYQEQLQQLRTVQSKLEETKQQDPSQSRLPLRRTYISEGSRSIEVSEYSTERLEPWFTPSRAIPDLQVEEEMWHPSSPRETLQSFDGDRRISSSGLWSSISSIRPNESRLVARPSRGARQQLLLLPTNPTRHSSKVTELQTNLENQGVVTCLLNRDDDPKLLTTRQDATEKDIVRSTLLWDAPLSSSGSDLLNTMRSTGWKPFYIRGSRFGQTYLLGSQPIHVHFFSPDYKPQYDAATKPSQYETVTIGRELIEEKVLHDLDIDFQLNDNGNFILDCQLTAMDIEALIDRSFTMREDSFRNTHRRLQWHRRSESIVDTSIDSPESRSIASSSASSVAGDSDHADSTVSGASDSRSHRLTTTNLDRNPFRRSSSHSSSSGNVTTSTQSLNELRAYTTVSEPNKGEHSVGEADGDSQDWGKILFGPGPELISLI